MINEMPRHRRAVALDVITTLGTRGGSAWTAEAVMKHVNWTRRHRPSDCKEVKIRRIQTELKTMSEAGFITCTHCGSGLRRWHEYAIIEPPHLVLPWGKILIGILVAAIFGYASGAI